ncbi:kinase [Catenovulum maritimum]|uniref:Kinase n=1 Tax=Catenovulum maritimum TaxID=1513271 RepID=A0A0J8H0P7_9ALTE|nr:kinase [Catenovulum maritimum]KMT66588.1 kinase [Catenovulum maritimum]
MIITRTPFRISFFGGGTDFPAFYDKHGGTVLSTTIDKYCYITARYLPPFFDHKYRIRYTKREETNSIDEISHPSVRACLNYAEITDGIEIVHTSDIPAMSGIGSSSSFTVGLLHSLYALKGLDVTKSELCQDALEIEQKILKENVGSQDQTAAAYGGLNKIKFSSNRHPIVSPIAIKRERRKELERHLMLFFTGFSRISSVVAAEQIKNTPSKIIELNAMKEMVTHAINILDDSSIPINEFGCLLHEAWMLKKSLTHKISNSEIDQMYEAAIAAGATGGKLCGAGAGGFMLLFVEPNKQSKVKSSLSKFLHVPFSFEQRGTHIVFSDNQ